MTPYLEADLYDMHFEQRNNTWHIVNTNGTYQPRELVRNTPTTFTLAITEYTFGPFLDDNITATTIASSGTTGTVTLTASTPIFLAGHVGAQFRIAGSTGSPARSGHVRITVFGTTTSVTAEVLHDLSSGTATTDWAEGTWSDVRGWPSTIDLFDERMNYAASDAVPEGYWASKPGEFTDFDVGSGVDGDALDFELSVRNRVRWIKSLVEEVDRGGPALDVWPCTDYCLWDDDQCDGRSLARPVLWDGHY